jgi:hypothetical protein
LDYLAVKFVEDQRWSIKQLVRSLLLTHAYQLSSDIDPKAAEADPADTLVWRAQPRRLKAEQLRDSILTASGRLDLTPPVFGVTAEFGDGYYGVNIWETDLPQHYYKRSVYLPLPRDMVPDSLSLFDLPNPNLVGAHREETTSPSQELFLMNNAFVQDESLHLAKRLLENKKWSNKERVRQAYLQAFQRLPISGEVKHAASFIEDEAKLLAAETPPQLLERASNPEAETNTAAPVVSVPDMTVPTIPLIVTNSEPVAASPAPVDTNTIALTTNAVAATGDAGGNFGGRGGFRFPRTYKGPGSASDTVVGKLAPGIARPKVFHQALPEIPASPEEAAFALFTQALLGSAEFRYIQ